MRIQKPTLSALILLVVFSTFTLANEHSGPTNVYIEDNLLRWDPVDGALGYNIYYWHPRYSSYITTVLDATEYRMDTEGTYVVVVSFPGNTFSAIESASARATFSHQTQNSDIGQNETINAGKFTLLRSNSCTNQAAGDVCAVACDANPGQVATGGACYSTDGAQLQSRGTFEGYTCETNEASVEVQVQVYCLYTYR